MSLLRTVRLSSTYLEVFTQKQHILSEMTKVPPCSVVRRSISYFGVQPCQAVLTLQSYPEKTYTHKLNFWGVHLNGTHL